MIILVLYCKIFSMDAARRCSRCDGKGHERARRAAVCPRCDGAGIRPDGWAYRVSDPEVAAVLALGDIVECPPTPYSAGGYVYGTVVALDGERYAPHTRPIKAIARRVGTQWPEGVSSR